jgi:hypothetical protein
MRLLLLLLLLGINGLEERDTAKVIAKVKALAPIAQELGVTQAQLAIAWVPTNRDFQHHKPIFVSFRNSEFLHISRTTDK